MRISSTRLLRWIPTAAAGLLTLGASPPPPEPPPPQPSTARARTLDVADMDTGAGLHRLLPVRRRRLAAEEPDPLRPAALGNLRRAAAAQPGRPARDPRAARRRQVGGDGLRRAQARRLLRRLHGRGGDRGEGPRRRSSPELAKIDAIHDRAVRCAPRSGASSRWASTRSSSSARRRTARTRRRSSPRRCRAGSACPTATTTSRRTRSPSTLRDQYVAHVAKMLELAGAAGREGRGGREDDPGARDEARRGVAEQRRHPQPDKTYHPMTVADLLEGDPEPRVGDATSRSRASPRRRRERVAARLLQGRRQAAARPSRCATWKTYLRWHLLSAAAPTLPKKFVDENFAFFGKTLVRHAREIQPRWKRCVTATDNAMGMALGSIYVEGVLPAGGEEARGRAGARTCSPRSHEDIKTLDWMSEATKKAAAAKIATFDPKIGYPDKWRDYSTLDDLARLTTPRNVARGNQFEWRRDLGEDRQARGPLRLGHDAAHGQRVLQLGQERDHVPGGHPAAAVLLSGGRRRHQLRRDRRRHRPRDHARLRQLGPQVRREGQPGRLVDEQDAKNFDERAEVHHRRSSTATSSSRTSTRTESSCRASRSRTSAA